MQSTVNYIFITLLPYLYSIVTKSTYSLITFFGLQNHSLLDTLYIHFLHTNSQSNLLDIHHQGVGASTTGARTRYEWNLLCDSLGRFLVKQSARFWSVGMWNRMSTALLRFCLMLSVAIPIAEVLSHMMIVGSCGQPMSVKVVRSYAACCPVANRAAYSASPALATTHGIIVEKTWMDPLILVGSF